MNHLSLGPMNQGSKNLSREHDTLAIGSWPASELTTCDQDRPAENETLSPRKLVSKHFPNRNPIEK